VALRGAIEEALGESTPRPRTSKPWVILVSGVNGVGKTTSIGKLTARFMAAGDRVLLVAADTFRAAAIDQLGVWAERVGADLVRHQSGADPAAVAFDGVKAAAAREVDVVIVDTAGRLHTRQNLMEELRKVTRVIGKAIPGAPHEVWLVLDATTGQNAIHQAKVFSEALGVTGIVITKLDGTAKGGAALAVREALGVPIVWLGVGEGVDDIRPFSAAEFATALVGEG
jgi:fused signal recognition particle receptor